MNFLASEVELLMRCVMPLWFLQLFSLFEILDSEALEFCYLTMLSLGVRLFHFLGWEVGILFYFSGLHVRHVLFIWLFVLLYFVFPVYLIWHCSDVGPLGLIAHTLYLFSQLLYFLIILYYNLWIFLNFTFQFCCECNLASNLS